MDLMSKLCSLAALLVSILVTSGSNCLALVSLMITVFAISLTITANMISKLMTKRPKTHEELAIDDSGIRYALIARLRLVCIQIAKQFFSYVFNKISMKLNARTTDAIDGNDYSSSAAMSRQFCGEYVDIENESQTVSHIITDKYIEFWYQLIGTDNEDFTTDCRQILQQIFCQLFDKCVKCVDKEVFARKVLILLETHLSDESSGDDQTFNECQRMEAIVDRLLRLLATEDITPIVRKDPNLGVYVILKQLLTHSVFIPIIDIISEQKFIYENLLFLITNTDYKLIDNKRQNGSKPRTPIVELHVERHHTIDSNECNSSPKIVLNDEKLLRFDSTPNLAEDNLRVTEFCSDFSGNESNDETLEGVVEALEADEGVDDEKLISNLAITRTEETKNSYHNSYTLYVIEYDALFQQTIEAPISGDDCVDEDICGYRERVTVYRRFSEFMTLQKLLDRNKTFRRQMKGIKKPSSIQITAQNLLAFAGSGNTRLDPSTIEFRRIYLQNFLRQLCNRKAIVDSLEFQQFMAFGTDGSIAFVGKKSNSLLNIDRVLYKGVKGAINIMKTALPVEPQIGRIDPNFGERMVAENERITISSIGTEVETNHCMQLERKLNIWGECWPTDETLMDSFDSRRDVTVGHELCEESASSISSRLGPRSRGDGCEDPTNESQEVCNEMTENITEMVNQNSELTTTTSSHAINCLILLLSNKSDPIRRLIPTDLLEFIFGSILQKYINHLLAVFVTKDAVVKHIHSLHSSIWPPVPSGDSFDVQNEVQTEPNVQNDTYLDQTVRILDSHVKYTLNSMNAYLSYISDKLSIDRFLSNSLSKLTNRNSNKLFVYRFLELLLNEIQVK